MGGLGLELFALFDVLGELGEGAIEALLVGIVVVPLLSGFGAVLRVVVLGLVWLALLMEGLVVWCEGGVWMVEAVEGLGDLSLVD